MYFYGRQKRSKVLEVTLPKLEREGRLKVDWLDGEKVYSVARKNGTPAMSIEHELGAGEGLIRIWRCRMDESEIFLERAFRGFAIVPEWGIRYPEERGTMLLYEHHTNQNFNHGGVMKSKLTRYSKHLPRIEEKVNRKVNVLFVIDATRHRVREFVGKVKPFLEKPVMSDISREPRYPFFFTDYKTFLEVPVGQALSAEIYFWQNGKEWKLGNDD
jgi:hypothetical protein